MLYGLAFHSNILLCKAWSAKENADIKVSSKREEKRQSIILCHNMSCFDIPGENEVITRESAPLMHIGKCHFRATVRALMHYAHDCQEFFVMRTLACICFLGLSAFSFVRCPGFEKRVPWTLTKYHRFLFCTFAFAKGFQV